MKYKDYNDNELLWYIAEDSEEATDILYKKYEPYIISFATKVYPFCKNSGVEVSDLIQEGRLGLYDAITHYNEERNTVFRTFALKCIMRKMISMVASTRRYKNKVLNESISYDSIIQEDGKRLESLLMDMKPNPEETLIGAERERKIIEETKKLLTDYEEQVFELKIANFSYLEIAKILDKDKKAIDNALQRIKVKMKKVLQEMIE